MISINDKITDDFRAYNAGTFLDHQLTPERLYGFVYGALLSHHVYTDDLRDVCPEIEIQKKDDCHLIKITYYPYDDAKIKMDDDDTGPCDYYNENRSFETIEILQGPIFDLKTLFNTIIDELENRIKI